MLRTTEKGRGYVFILQIHEMCITHYRKVSEKIVHISTTHHAGQVCYVTDLEAL